MDARDLARDHRGLGRYARALLRRFVRFDALQLTLVARGPWPWVMKRAVTRVVGSANFIVAGRIPKTSAVAWHPWNGIFLRGGRTHVATIADATPFKFPATDPARRAHQQAPFLEAVARADRLITLSHAAKRDLVEILGAQPERVTVTYLGVDESFSPGAPAELPPRLQSRPYFFFVGDPAEPRKNFALLHRAFGRAWPRDDGPALAVLCARDPALPGVVHLPIDDEDIEGVAGTRLRSLYRGALATVVPSLYEGFGMPLLESMACGTPVLAARASSLPEIAGEAALLEDPNAEEAWAQALQRIAQDGALRDSLRERGLQNARRFSWDRCAQQTYAVLADAADLQSSSP